MSYCADCKEFFNKKFKTGFGTFSQTCRKYNIGINLDTWSCPQIKIKDKK